MPSTLEGTSGTALSIRNCSPNFGSTIHSPSSETSPPGSATGTGPTAVTRPSPLEWASRGSLASLGPVGLILSTV
jgi:hypothetical protein